MGHFNTLQDLFEDVLRKYENAESTCIGEFSINMKEDYEELEEKISLYGKEFERLYELETGKEKSQKYEQDENYEQDVVI